MRKNIFIILMLLMTTAVQAQTSPSYDEIKTKIHHIAECFLGYKINNEQALVIVLQRLCDYYQGRMSQQQYKVIAADINMIKAKASDREHICMIEKALQTLQSKTDTLDIEQRILDYYKRVPQEQIYVHTDKPYYVPGDTVWFRAHLVDAVTHTPISRSRYVYVELHDQQADTLVQRIIVKCDSDGVFANALILPRKLHGGSYTLAAYTQWMRNFPAERFFYKLLTVVGNQPQANHEFSDGKVGLYLRETQSLTPVNSHLEIAQRKGQLLIQLNKPTNEPLSCVLYGSGNLIVVDYPQGKVLRVDSRSLRPGSLNVAMVNRETGNIIAENQTFIEGKDAQVTISGKVQSDNDPMELNIDIADAEGKPLKGNFSLSVTDYDVVKPDTLQPAIDKYLSLQPTDYSLANMLRGVYPHIDYSFQTSQTISGSISSTLFKKVKRPKLMLIHPETGLRETFELGDSTRFTINGLDFPDGTTYLLEGMRRTGSTSLLQLNIVPMTFPVIHSPLTSLTSPLTIPASFLKQAREQVMYGSVDREIELPEVVKEKKRQRKENRMKIEPFKALYDDNPRLNNFNSMEILLNTLGLKVGRDDDNNYKISSWTLAGIGTLVYIDDVESNAEELMSLEPANLKSIEYFKHNDPRLLAYRWDGPTKGVLVVYLKPGYTGRSGKPLSMATVHQQGWKPNVEFFSPQYMDKSQKTRPDHRTTLYWNPKVTTDANGKVSVKFYASDISKRYLVTLEGISSDGTIVHQQQVIE